MSVKLLTEHHFEILSLKEGSTSSSEPTQSVMSKYHMVGNHMPRPNYIFLPQLMVHVRFLDSFVFRTAVLEPDFDLTLSETENLG